MQDKFEEPDVFKLKGEGIIGWIKEADATFQRVVSWAETAICNKFWSRKLKYLLLFGLWYFQMKSLIRRRELKGKSCLLVAYVLTKTCQRGHQLHDISTNSVLPESLYRQWLSPSIAAQSKQWSSIPSSMESEAPGIWGASVPSFCLSLPFQSSMVVGFYFLAQKSESTSMLSMKAGLCILFSRSWWRRPCQKAFAEKDSSSKEAVTYVFI